MSPIELLGLLQDFYRETAELVLQRQDRARSVTAYDANNAYQQILGRQDTHLSWLSDAIVDLGGVPPAAPAGGGAARTGKAELGSVVEVDARSQHLFLSRWTPRVQTVTNARHRKLLELILGEMAEHFRMLTQVLEGRSDVLGRHAEGKVLRGEVLPDRPGQA